MAAPVATAPPAQAGEHPKTSALPNVNGKDIRQWPRDKWLEAMWETETLTANERCVAYAYARYAGRSDITWCHWDELRKRTGIRSRDAIHRAIKGLLSAGWIVLSEAAKQHYSARYRLTIPSQQSGRRTAEPPRQRSSSPAGGHLDRVEPAPDVRETDIPDVRQMNPDVRETDPSTQTENSDLQPGGTLPPDPLRHDDPPGRRTEQDQLLTLVVDLNATKQVTTRPRTPAIHSDRPLLALIDDDSPAHPVDDAQLELLNPHREQQWAAMQTTITHLTTAPTGATA